MSYAEQFGQALVTSMTERMNPMNAAISQLVTGQAKDQSLAIEDRITATILNIKAAISKVNEESNPDTSVLEALQRQLARVSAMA